jgi:hypothetical protein
MEACRMQNKRAGNKFRKLIFLCQISSGMAKERHERLQLISYIGCLQVPVALSEEYAQVKKASPMRWAAHILSRRILWIALLPQSLPKL